MSHLSFLSPGDRRRLAEALSKNAKEDPKEVIKDIRTIPKDEPAEPSKSEGNK